MNTSFAGNQVGSIVTLDITNTYPTGLLSQLGPYYNDSQELINAQLRFTANQADITSESYSANAIDTIALEKTGTIAPISADTQSAATVYINQANQVNYTNQKMATLINAEYTNAYAIEKACRDASYSAFLTTEASQIRLDKISSNSVVSQLANSPININPLYILNSSTISTMVSNFEQTSQTALNDASGNLQAYITNTQLLLNNAIIKSSSVTANRTLVAAFNTLVRTVAEAVSFPLLEIAGKETLVTQNIPSIILTVAIHIVNKAQAFLTALLTNTITTQISSANYYATTLDSIARSHEINMYFQDKLQDNLKKSSISINLTSAYDTIKKEKTAAAATAAANARAIGSLNIAAATDKAGYTAAAEATLVAIAAAAASISPVEARRLALNAGISARNARAVSNAIINLNTAYSNTTIKEPIISTTASESVSIIASMLSTINVVTTNSSAHSGVAISKTASNTILGTLKNITEKEKISLESAEDANSVLLLLNKAYNINSTITDISSIQNKHWATNAASARAKEVSEKLKDKAFLFNKTANNFITPSQIATQTAGSIIAGANISKSASMIDRNSRNVFPLPPPAYNGFKAEIRAKTIMPIRPSLSQLVFRNRIEPLRLDSLRTINATNIKITQDVQQIKDLSIHSFKK